MSANRIALLAALLVVAGHVSLAETITKTTANNGNLVMEDVPPIPEQLVETLNRYQNVRSAASGWRWAHRRNAAAWRVAADLYARRRR